jgi:hypothetical protein
MSRQSELEAMFRQRSIDYSDPEFYNLPSFIEAEQSDPKMLWEYADYVRTRLYSKRYVDKAREIVPLIVDFLYHQLIEDGRLGACLDMSLSASKIFEQLGYWCSIQVGSLTLEIPTAPNRKIRHWADFMISESPAKVGHAWLIVPPFAHIDITITRQKENDDLVAFIPSYVIVDKVEPLAGVRFEDVVDIDLANAWMRQFGELPTIGMVMKENPDVARYLSRFRPFSVTLDKATLKYFPCRTTAAQERFHEMKGHCFSGRSTREVFEDLIKKLGPVKELSAPKDT